MYVCFWTTLYVSLTSCNLSFRRFLRCGRGNFAKSFGAINNGEQTRMVDQAISTKNHLQHFFVF